MLSVQNSNHLYKEWFDAIKSNEEAQGVFRSEIDYQEVIDLIYKLQKTTIDISY